MSEQLSKKRVEGEMLYQRTRRLIRSLTGSLGLQIRKQPSESPLRLGQTVLVQCPEIEELEYLLKNALGCPTDPLPPGPGKLGLILAATASHLEADRGTIDCIEDGCPLACTPRREPCRRCVFVLRANKGLEGDCLRYGQEIFFELANHKDKLYMRSETPILDGKFSPNYHNPVQLNLTRDCYAKWRALHWDKNKRFETEGMPVMPCARVVLQHVMTGKCLAAENYNWHYSIIGYECGISVHSYKDVHRNETSQCIWNMIVVEKAD